MDLMSMLRQRVQYGGQPQGPPDLSNVSIPNPTDPKSIQPKPNLIDLLSGLNPDDVQALTSQGSIKQARQQGLLGAGLSLLASGGRQAAYQRPNLGQALQGALQSGQQGYAGVLQAAQALQGDRTAKQQQAGLQALYKQYGPQLESTDPAVAQGAWQAVTAKAVELGIPNVVGPLSQIIQANAGLRQGRGAEPEYVSIKGVDANGREIEEYVTKEEAVKRGPRVQYVAPKGDGSGVNWQTVQGADGGLVQVNPRTGQTRPVAGPDGKPLMGKATKIPVTVANAMAGNDLGVKRIQDAIDRVTANPQSIGWLAGLAPDYVANIAPYLKDGQRGRTGLSDVRSIILHNRFGSAMTKTELQQAGFLPDKSDPPDVVLEKLQRMMEFAKQEQKFMQEMYPAVPVEGEGGKQAALDGI